MQQTWYRKGFVKVNDKKTRALRKKHNEVLSFFYPKSKAEKCT